MTQKKVGTVLVSHVTKAGTPIRYQVIAIADGRKRYGLTYAPVKGILIVRRMLKDGSLTGKRRMWAA